MICSVYSVTIVFSCKIVSFSSLSWISFALEAIVSLLGYHILIVLKTGLLSRENATWKLLIFTPLSVLWAGQYRFQTSASQTPSRKDSGPLAASWAIDNRRG